MVFFLSFRQRSFLPLYNVDESFIVDAVFLFGEALQDVFQDCQDFLQFGDVKIILGEGG